MSCSTAPVVGETPTDEIFAHAVENRPEIVWLIFRPAGHEKRPRSDGSLLNAIEAQQQRPFRKGKRLAVIKPPVPEACDFGRPFRECGTAHQPASTKVDPYQPTATKMTYIEHFEQDLVKKLQAAEDTASKVRRVSEEVASASPHPPCHPDAVTFGHRPVIIPPD
jgi:hypothetical protein